MRTTVINASPRAFDKSSDATTAIEAANAALRIYAEKLEAGAELRKEADKMSPALRKLFDVDEKLNATNELDKARHNAYVLARATYLAKVAQIPEPSKELFGNATADMLRDWNRASMEDVSKLPLKHN